MTKTKTLSRSSSVSPLRLPPSLKTHSLSNEASKTRTTTLKIQISKTNVNNASTSPSTPPTPNRGREALKEGHNSSAQTCKCSQNINIPVKKSSTKNPSISNETVQEQKMLHEEHCCYPNEDTPSVTHPISSTHLNHYSYEDFKRSAYVEWITIEPHQHNITEP